MTWKELAEKIQALTPRQQEMEAMIERFVDIPSYDPIADLEVIYQEPTLTH